MKKMAVSFASSDGCMPMPPTPSHRRAPLIGARKVHGHERERHEAESRPDERRLFVDPVVHPHHDVEHRDAEQRPHALREQESRRAAVALERDRRRRAVHHDDADAHQQDGGENSTLSDFSFLAISSKAGLDFLRKQCRDSNYDRHERSAVISRRRAEAPASQAGAAWVPSSQSSTASTD
jgi:hypothetical protein